MRCRKRRHLNGNGEAAKYQYNGLGHRVGKVVGQEGFQTINKELDSVKRLQSQTISPDNQIRYTIDLTREYHNLLQKEEDVHIQSFLWDGNVAGMLGNGKDSASYKGIIKCQYGENVQNLRAQSFATIIYFEFVNKYMLSSDNSWIVDS